MSVKTVFSPLMITTLSLIGIVLVGTISFLSIEVFAPKSERNKSLSSSITAENKLSNSNSSFGDTSSVQILDRVSVSNQDVKIDFSFNPNTQQINYTGEVVGANGCVYIKEHDLNLENSKIILKVLLRRKGELCTQAITSLPIKGNKIISLSTTQREDFKNLFEVVVVK